MARSAWVRNARLFCLVRRYKAKGVSVDIVVFDRLLDLGHVAGNTLASCAAFSVVSMLTHRSSQTRWIVFGMAGEA